ncbi:MAG: OB-fold domain-containing protein [Syntrophorhabdales bacterium]|jgi:3-hydroxy-3-methylglutaryl CoA synthase
MVGITSIGVYVPVYRISRDEIGRMWGARSPGGEKAVAGCDEDSITMAVAAGLDLMKDNREKIDSLFFATTTAPYKEKQSASIVASALDLDRDSPTCDFANSLRAGASAMKSATDAVRAGSSEHVMVTTSDCRLGAAQGTFEQVLGDGAAALTIGAKGVIADIEASYSVFNEFTDAWRTDEDEFMRGSEERFVENAGYQPVMKEVVSGLMSRSGLTTGDFSRVVFYAPDGKSHAGLAKGLGFDKAQVQDPLFFQIGNTGSPAPFIMLAAALEKASAGDRILFMAYGDGADAFVLRVTEDIGKVRIGLTIEETLKRNIPIVYGKYAQWRGLVKAEASRLFQPSAPSLKCLWREKKNILAFYGVRCKACGTPQYPENRICVVCRAKDNFEDYKFSDKRGRLFTFSVDVLQPTLNPPGVNGVVDFDGGGRLISELTDCQPEKVEVGMPIEMTFRRLYRSSGINNYFWKAKPASVDGSKD